ncbi:hypothetical protein C9J60_09625 [Streptomyces sp. A244]|nr:hypothetical protein C9J60_09625 [Streptomyces sp. A244]
MTSSRRQTLGPDTSATSYRSAACQIGTHQACAESTPDSAPVDLPLIYEACGCLCHSASDQSRPGGDAARNPTTSGTPAPNHEAIEGRA